MTINQNLATISSDAASVFNFWPCLFFILKMLGEVCGAGEGGTLRSKRVGLRSLYFHPLHRCDRR